MGIAGKPDSCRQAWWLPVRSLKEEQAVGVEAIVKISLDLANSC